MLCVCVMEKFVRSGRTEKQKIEKYLKKPSLLQSKRKIMMCICYVSL